MNINIFIQQAQSHALLNFQLHMPSVPRVGDLLNLTSMSPLMGIKDKLEIERSKIQYVKVTQVEYVSGQEWIAKVHTQAILPTR